MTQFKTILKLTLLSKIPTFGLLQTTGVHCLRETEGYRSNYSNVEVLTSIWLF